MQIVIDISENMIEEIENNRFGKDRNDSIILAYAVMRRITLPKGHGRLIDADALIRKAYEEAQGMTNNNFGVEVEWIVDKTPAIIEAGSEEK